MHKENHKTNGWIKEENVFKQRLQYYGQIE